MKKMLAFIVIIVLAFSGCTSDTQQESGSDSSVAADDKYGGIIKMACVPVDTLNPLVTKKASVVDFLSLIYEGLFVTMPDLTAKPVLATEYMATEDNTVYTINLKNGVRFHNGKTFTAEDVVATLNYIAMYSENYVSVMENIASYTATDSDTVVITLKNPAADFINILDFPILPAGLPEDDFISPNSGFVPQGTGMYKYESNVEYKNIYLKANTQWHCANGRPCVDGIDVEILSDEETIISAFDAGAIDILTSSWRTPVEINLTSSLYKVSEAPLSNRFTFVGINTACAALDTVEERRLLAETVDAAKICEDVMLGYAQPAHSPVREGVYFNEAEENEESDRHSNENFMTTADIDRSIQIILLYNCENKTKERVALAVKHQLETAGYSVVLDAQPASVYFDKVVSCSYDLYIGETAIDNSANLSYMFGSERSTQNICCYRDEKLYNLVLNINRMSGKDNRIIAWENFEEYYETNVFQIPLYFTNGAVFINRNIRGTLNPNASSLLYGFENLYIS